MSLRTFLYCAMYVDGSAALNIYRENSTPPYLYVLAQYNRDGTAFRIDESADEEYIKSRMVYYLINGSPG